MVRFAPGLVSTEKERVKRFISGLKPMIQKDLSILEFTTCAKILNKALKLKKGYTQLQDQNYQGERKRPHPDNLLHGQKSDERNNKKQWNHNKKIHNQNCDSDEDRKSVV